MDVVDRVEPAGIRRGLLSPLCPLCPLRRLRPLWLAVSSQRCGRSLPTDVAQHVRMDVQTEIGQVVNMFGGYEPDDLADPVSEFPIGLRNNR